MGLREMFKSLDTDNSGTITLDELRAGLPKLGTKITESEIRQLMEAVYLLNFSSSSFLSMHAYLISMTWYKYHTRNKKCSLFCINANHVLKGCSGCALTSKKEDSE